MRYLRWGFWIAVIAIVGGFLHYTLPQRDIVRIVGTENRRIDIGDNSLFWNNAESGMAQNTSRDVFFIDAVYPNGKVMTYRNQDTGWGWPPYFKINSYGLQAEAKELTSTADKPIWVAVTHYGWRNQFFTIFPNAVRIKRIDGPEVTLIPWANIIILSTLLIILLVLRHMWLQFRERMIDPALDRIDRRRDEAQAGMRTRWRRIQDFFRRK